MSVNKGKLLDVEVNVGKEIQDTATDFLKPIEVLREAVSNAYDAGATELTVTAKAETDDAGRRILTVEFRDNGIGMDEGTLRSFFGLGMSEKPEVENRKKIGFKGHGTKTFYSAGDVWVSTRRSGALTFAVVENARKQLLKAAKPEPFLFSGADADFWAADKHMELSGDGTVIRLQDFTADSGRLIDEFKRAALTSYLRWFTVAGSIGPIFSPAEKPSMTVRVQGTNDDAPDPIEWGHPWAKPDVVDLKELQKKDSRRPFNFFLKSFVEANVEIEGGFRADLAVQFEGRRGRLARDLDIKRQGSGGLYLEEERYGLWLCKDHIPVEMHSEWLQEIDGDLFRHLEPRRALVFVNCDDFKLTGNRGSVGNSDGRLLDGVRKAVQAFFRKLEDDQDVSTFAEEYKEEKERQAREKDRKAVRRRLDRFNRKALCTVTLKSGAEHRFMEPDREVSLFGLLSQLLVLDSGLLGFEILDFDDYTGIDLLVRRNGDVGNLLKTSAVAYVEMKFILTNRLNHAFDWLSTVVCWKHDLTEGAKVVDAANQVATFHESKDNKGVTFASLVPDPAAKVQHNVRVIALEQLLKESRGMKTEPNPRRIS